MDSCVMGPRMEIAAVAQVTVVTPTGIAKLAVKSFLALAIILKTYLRMELVVDPKAISARVAALASAAAVQGTAVVLQHTATLVANQPLALVHPLIFLQTELVVDRRATSVGEQF